MKVVLKVLLLFVVPFIAGFNAGDYITELWHVWIAVLIVGLYAAAAIMVLDRVFPTKF